MKRIGLGLAFVSLIAGCVSEPAESEFVSLSGGCFVMGENPVYSEEGPPIETCVEPFELAAKEVTNADFSAFVEATGYKTRAERGWLASEPGGPGIDLPEQSAVFVLPDRGSGGNPNWWRLVAGANWRHPSGPNSTINGRDDDPVVHVTREDAEAYAEWAGGRLPTEAEWEFAARGSPVGEISPWSEVEYVARTNRANTWQGVFPIQNTNDDSYEGVAPVGSFPANAFGLYDMIGNVWEWTATPFAPTHSERDREIAGERGFDPGQPNAAVGTIKGGSYLCAENYCARFRPAARQAQDLAFGTSHIGFRIARDAPARTN